ncbi:MAG: hypothetical protein KDB18_09320, partial [Salinibacterium sp.]|nr:hypothetical protein [Salinibacterium sp.]
MHRTACAVALMLWAGMAASATDDLVPPTPYITQTTVGTDLHSGLVAPPARQDNGPAKYHVVYSDQVTLDGATALRLIFDSTRLAAPTADGHETYLLITSMFDGHQQVLTSKTLKEWKHTSAYFNGDSVTVEIYSPEGAGDSQVAVSSVIMESPVHAVGESLCGTSDDRVLSSDPRSGRIWPIGCTAWLFDGRPNCLNTAGHCGPASDQVIEFNVPLSSTGGTPQHPGPQDQYVIDPVSVQTNGGQGIGNDWSTFGVFNNANTGLSPLSAQGGVSYTLADMAPGGTGQSIRVTGFGSTSSPVSPTWYLVQKTHAGPYAGLTGLNIKYAMDTTGGNSGSAVEDETTGLTIGIHTHAGCNSTGGANNGTAVQHPDFQFALDNPRGICAFGMDIVLLGERPSMLVTGEDVDLSVSINVNGVTLDPSSVTLHVDNGSGFVSIPMVAQGGDEFAATFQATDCIFFSLFFFFNDT